LAVLPPLLVYWIAPDSLAALPLAVIMILVWTHLPFYNYASEKRNSAFAFAMVPMQVIFFLGCVISTVLGVARYYLGGERAHSGK
jgi:hypothetical protein